MISWWFKLKFYSQFYHFRLCHCCYLVVYILEVCIEPSHSEFVQYIFSYSLFITPPEQLSNDVLRISFMSLSYQMKMHLIPDIKSRPAKSVLILYLLSWATAKTILVCSSDTSDFIYYIPFPACFMWPSCVEINYVRYIFTFLLSYLAKFWIILVQLLQSKYKFYEIKHVLWYKFIISDFFFQK